MALDNKYMINGPINVIRLLGSVNGVEKIIYFFCMYPRPIISETLCDSIYATDIHTYLADTLYRSNGTNRIYDIFVPAEEGRSEYNRSTHTSTVTYRMEIINLLTKIRTNNMSRLEPRFDNIRVHHLASDTILKNIYAANTFIKNITDVSLVNIEYNTKEFENVINALTDLRKNILDVIHIINKFTDRSENKIHVTLDDAIVYELFNNYRDDNIKTLVTEIKKNILATLRKIPPYIDDVIERIAIAINKLDDSGYREILSNRYNALYDIVTRYQKITILARDTIVMLDCVNLIKSFLDSSACHIGFSFERIDNNAYFLSLLVNRFGFTITHLSFSKIPIDDLHKEINKCQAPEDFTGDDFRKYLYRDILHQCSDLSSFPPDLN